MQCAVVLSLICACLASLKQRGMKSQVFNGNALSSSAFHAGLVVGDIAPRYIGNARSAQVVCNGVFVEKDWVLTSKDCVSSNVQDYGVVHSVDPSSTGATVRANEAIWIVARYAPHEHLNLALVQVLPDTAGNLFTATDGPQPIPVTQTTAVVGEAVNVRGYGCDASAGPQDPPCQGSPRLRESPTQIISLADAVRAAALGQANEDVPEESVIFTENLMCFGDAGGAVYRTDSDGNNVLLGIFQGSSAGCGNANAWSAYTDVSLAYDWIQETTACDDLQVLTTDGRRAKSTSAVACFQLEGSNVEAASELHLQFPSADWQLADAAVTYLEGVEHEVSYLNEDYVPQTSSYTVYSGSDRRVYEQGQCGQTISEWDRPAIQVRFPAPMAFSAGNHKRRIKLFLTGLVNPNNCDEGQYAASAWSCTTSNLMRADPPVYVRRCGSAPVSMSSTAAGSAFSDHTPCLFCDQTKSDKPVNTPRGCTLCNACTLFHTSQDGTKTYQCEHNGRSFFRSGVGTTDGGDDLCDPVANCEGPKPVDSICSRVPDPCDYTTCDTPPADYCVGRSVASYTVGVCSRGDCMYTPTVRECSAGQICRSGVCQDACLTARCDEPPSARCEGRNRVTYSLPGTCSDGECTYVESSVECLPGFICSVDECIQEPTCPTATGYVGCFKDDNARNLDVYKGVGYDRDSCESECSGYTFFALQSGRYCYCGDSYGGDQYTEVPCSDCLDTCLDGSSDTPCGGSFRNAVYRTNTTLPNFPGYQGCFSDVVGNRAFSVYKGQGRSHEQCQLDCSDYTYYALQAGNVCYCGSALPDTSVYSQVNDNWCYTRPCKDGTTYEKPCGYQMMNAVVQR